MRNRRTPLFAAPLGSLMRGRKLALVIAGATVTQGAAAWVGISGWQCPLLLATGLPCPGCGLSRAVAALARGEVGAALTLHAFAPALVTAVLLLAGAAVLPEQSRLRLVSGVETVERYTGLTAVLLISLIVYWVGRLLFSPEAFILLARG